MSCRAALASGARVENGGWPPTSVAVTPHVAINRKRVLEVTIVTPSPEKLEALYSVRNVRGRFPTLIDGRRPRAATKAPQRKAVPFLWASPIDPGLRTIRRRYCQRKCP